MAAAARAAETLPQVRVAVLGSAATAAYQVNPKPMPLLDQADITRFWAKVDTSGGLDSCWPWMACRDRKGYGRFWLGRRMEKAHRVAWMLVQGPIPEGQDVLHRCDHPPCCNMVKCGFLGTQADNMADKMAKGRQVTPRGERNGSRLHPERLARGERMSRFGKRNGSARLTAEQVEMIRVRVATGPRGTQAALARAYGVNHTAISKIVCGETWRHIG